jgi:hypothetical protein
MVTAVQKCCVYNGQGFEAPCFEIELGTDANYI